MLDMATGIHLSATEFKAKCLELLDRVGIMGETILITKRGKVVAQLGPAESAVAGPGVARGSLSVVGEIVEPFDAGWENR